MPLPPPVIDSVPIASDLQALRDMIAQQEAQISQQQVQIASLSAKLSSRSLEQTPNLGARQQLPPTEQAQLTSAPSAIPSLPSVPSLPTVLPDAHGILPPLYLQSLTLDTVPSTTRASDFELTLPAPLHLASLRMFPDLNPSSGTFTSLTSLAIRVKSHASLFFHRSDAMLLAFISGSLGEPTDFLYFGTSPFLQSSSSGGVAPLAYFGKKANKLPTIDTSKPTYNRLSVAAAGFAAATSAFCYSHIKEVADAVNLFIQHVRSMDTDQAPARAIATHKTINTLISRAFSQLRRSDPSWWKDFRAAVKDINPSSVQFLSTLTFTSLSSGSPPRKVARKNTSSRSSSSSSSIPPHIRKLIPKDSDGNEPCLRAQVGACSIKGLACGGCRRIHAWPDKIPEPVLTWAKSTYTSKARTQA